MLDTVDDGVSRRRHGVLKLGAVMVCIATTVVSSGEVRLERLMDFTAGAEAWPSIDDVVMGGVSKSEMVVEGGAAVFTGRLSLARGGGFCSVRSRPGAYDLSECSALVIRVRGDGHRYRLRLRTTAAFDGVSYESTFATRAGRWQEIELPLESFRPVFRGRTVPDAPPLDRSAVTTFGLLISDRQAGTFRLEVAWIAGQTLSDRADA